VPANAALVVAGDVDVAQVRQWAKNTTARYRRARACPRKPRQEPVQAGVRRIEVKAPAEQAYVALAFKVPGLSATGLLAQAATPADDDALALTVLAAVLDGYGGARLDRGLTQGDDRVADSAGAYNGLWGRGPQLFVLDGVPAKGRTAEQVEQALREQVARIAREGVSAGRTRAREDPVGGQRGLQARLPVQPGAQPGQLLGRGPAAGCR
jgi:zinc protease